MPHFELELDNLNQRLLGMASRATTAVNTAVRAFLDRDDALALQVEADDSLLDHLEVELDEMAIRLLAQAPGGSDLRLIAVVMKITQNLERIGDEATTISRRVLELNKEPELKPHIEILQMAQMALAMLDDALDGFVHRKPDQARAIISRDQQVDHLNKRHHRELRQRMIDNPSTIGRCLELMVISKCLERIADHAANVAEEVVYLCDATDIRHTHPAEPAGQPSTPDPGRASDS